MINRIAGSLVVLSLLSAIILFSPVARATDIDKGWLIQSSAKVPEKGDVVSTTAFKPSDWYPADMPSTVMAALVAAKVYPDPYFGMNMRSIPGVSYNIGQNFSNLPMPEDSPFRVPWWFRKEFQFEKKPGEVAWLQFDGINFRANIWLNGKRLADSKQVAGAYRTYEFNVTDFLSQGQTNALAVEIFAPEPTDLAITWVDWNPMPPDKNMGIWRGVRMRTSGPVSLRYPQVTTKLDLPSLDRAHLTVTAELHNATDRPVSAEWGFRMESSAFTDKVQLAPKETKVVTVNEEKCACLRVDKPRLWWPVQMGPQNLYDIRFQVEADRKPSDLEAIRFGIREVTSELNEQKYRVFKVNGKPVLVRGGGWAPDMMLRPSLEREIAEFKYVKDMNLNTIRFEGKTETRRFLEMCDREGILVIAGWCCCDHWEKSEKWDAEDYEVSALSLRDQLKRIRHHPSLLTWWYGSDGPPIEKAEERYLEVLKSANWPNPYQSSATAKPTTLGGETGLRMTGPYEWVPPHYWYVDTKRGGAYSFNTETSPGPAVPPVESLRLMLPREHLWPIDEYWNYHAGGGAFKTIQVFTNALNKRYGVATGLEDYARKAQMMAYEGERAMFEAYSRNKFVSTGVIQWMMNNAWPSMIWHLYDYYLRPGGGYFGTKKACEPVHIQYSYDDHSIVVVNSTLQDANGLKARVRVLNLDASEKLARDVPVDSPANTSRRIFTVPSIEGLTPTYFVHASLADAAGKTVRTNFYWLSTKPETLNEAKATWYFTPALEFADFTGISSLQRVALNVSSRAETVGEETLTRVTLENPSKSLAFFIRLKLKKGQNGDEILPVLWQDNYISLLPGEKREIAALIQTSRLGGVSPALELEGWNVNSKTQLAGR
jgi:exo-1,4-beta-D-glucosaminidase